MKNIIRFCFFALVLSSVLPAYGAGVFAPFTYVTPSSDNKYVFVMLAPGTELNASEQARKIKARYPKSGMYPGDGAVKPLWTVDWYSFSVFVAADGVHLVRQGALASSLADEAFTFFASGKELRSYKVGDVARRNVLQMASHFVWLADIRLDDADKSLAVKTLGDEKYSFDYRNGEKRVEQNELMAIGKSLSFAENSF